MTFPIINKDSVVGLRELLDASVELIVTSPPYSDIRRYQNRDRIEVWDFETTAREIYRVLCAGGVLCWVIGDQFVKGSLGLDSCKQKIYFVEQCGFTFHQRLIYQKRNFSHPQKNRYHEVAEEVLVMSKGRPRTFNPLMDRKNLTAGAIGNLGVNTFTERDGSKSVRPKTVTKEFGMRHSVWLGNTRGQEECCKKLNHPAMMPKWLARDLILSWSNPGDLVVDPFMGSGTVCTEALKIGRRALGIEINSDYCNNFSFT